MKIIMLFACNIFLANVLPSLRISPLFLTRIIAIVLLYVATLSFNVVYIQSIGFDIGFFSELFIFSLVPVKPAEDQPLRRLTKEEKSKLSLSDELRQILVGLFLGDLYAQKPKGGINVFFGFKQSIVHKDYLLHLYDLFKIFSSQAPKITNMAPHKLTGKVYSSPPAVRSIFFSRVADP